MYHFSLSWSLYQNRPRLLSPYLLSSRLGSRSYSNSVLSWLLSSSNCCCTTLHTSKEASIIAWHNQLLHRTFEEDACQDGDQHLKALPRQGQSEPTHPHLLAFSILSSLPPVHFRLLLPNSPSSYLQERSFTRHLTPLASS